MEILVRSLSGRAPVAQLDRAPASGAGGFRFDSGRAYHILVSHIHITPSRVVCLHAIRGLPKHTIVRGRLLDPSVCVQTPRRLRSSSACSSTARSFSITLLAFTVNMVPQAGQRRRGDDWIVATVCAVFSPQRGQGIFTRADGSMLYGMAGA